MLLRAAAAAAAASRERPGLQCHHRPGLRPRRRLAGPALHQLELDLRPPGQRPLLGWEPNACLAACSGLSNAGAARHLVCTASDAESVRRRALAGATQLVLAGTGCDTVSKQLLPVTPARHRHHCHFCGRPAAGAGGLPHAHAAGCPGAQPPALPGLSRGQPHSQVPGGLLDCTPCHLYGTAALLPPPPLLLGDAGQKGWGGCARTLLYFVCSVRLLSPLKRLLASEHPHPPCLTPPHMVRTLVQKPTRFVMVLLCGINIVFMW